MHIRSQSQSYVTIDGQSASLSWRQAPIWGPRPIFLFFSLEIIFLTVAGLFIPSLTRGKAYSFQLLLSIASTVFLGPESKGTHEQILVSLFLTLPQPGGPGSCI
jgi:hypothetical protein